MFEGRRTVIVLIVVAFAVVVVSAVLDMRDPNDYGGGIGCHRNWFGVVPIGAYCGSP